MRYLLILLAFLSITTLAQDKPLLKVISASGIASIGGRTLSPGMDILETSGDENIEVSRRGYMNVITIEGDLFKITGKVTPKRVVKKARESRNRLSATGAVHYAASQFSFPMVERDSRKAFLVCIFTSHL